MYDDMRNKETLTPMKIATITTLLAILLFSLSAFAQDDSENPLPFNERYRPQFHYTTVKGWINDPIGLVYYKGEYHIFNDHNPFSCRFPGGKTDGEQSHWSHAISSDLVHWKHMPIAVYPDTNGACWSGSGVVDWRNTTGFQTGKEPPLILVYTSAGKSFGQSLVYSNDRGRTWNKYKGNPVIKQIGPIVIRKPQSSRSRVSYPPRLPGGISAATATSDELLKPPSSLKRIAVAKTAPVVDFLYYPGQTYPGSPWSNWGDGVATSGKYYSSIGDHKGPDGNAFVYEYDPKTKDLCCIVKVRKVLNLPEGHYTPGKIHGRLDMGVDGWLYFSTHRGSTRVTTDQHHYRGDWILRHHPKTGKTEIVVHGPVGEQCIPCSMLDPDRLIFYGGTVAGDITDKRNMFFAYDIKASKLLYSGYNGPARYMIFAKSTGRVYFTPGLAGRLYRYDPRKGGSPVGLSAEVGLRAATLETPQGFVYTVSKENAMLYRFDTKTEKVMQLGSAAIGSQTYITTIDADLTGRYLYYVPGAHGGSENDGAAVVQFDVETGNKKVIAFLHPFLKKRYGYTPLGTFSTAVDPAGDKLYITWNGNLGGSRRGRLTWDACALTVINIPESERLP